jgi:hypothetical protein
MAFMPEGYFSPDPAQGPDWWCGRMMDEGGWPLATNANGDRLPPFGIGNGSPFCLERVMGFEPTNNDLEGRCLTTWRHPRCS